MSEHTQGPWEADSAKSDEGHVYHQIDAVAPWRASVGFPCTVVDSLNRDASISPEEDAANARLISAAPDLLFACRLARKLAFALSFKPELTLGIAGADLLPVLDAAISKAAL
jgi:hypothetical protein